MASRMRVGIDGWFIPRGRGLGNHARYLIEALARWHPELSLVVYLPQSSDGPGAGACPESVRRRYLRKVPFPIWEQLLLPAAARRDGVSMLHCPFNTGPLRRWTSDGQLVLTIHDTMFMGADRPLGQVPYQQLGAAYRRQVTPRAARASAAVITVSNDSRNAIVRDLNLDPGKITVIPNAPGRRFRVMDGFTARHVAGLLDPQPFILGLAATDPRKNMPRILASFARYRQQGGDRRLVLAGADGQAQSRLRHLIASFQLEADVRVLGFLQGEELVAMYNLADVLLYPSLGEGFGLPVLEAMACGTPVITSSTSALPEVAGDAAILVDPASEDEIAGAMLRVLGDERLRRELVGRGLVQASRYSWRRAAAQTARVYEALHHVTA